MKLYQKLVGAIVLMWCAVVTIPYAYSADTSTPSCMATSMIDDQPVDLKILRGKIVYVDFWASWCGPCKESFKFLNQLHAENTDPNFEIFAVSVDVNRKDAEKFVQLTKPNFPIAIESKGACPKSFGLKGMPAAYILAADGTILYSHNGFRKTDASKIRNQLQQILN